MYANLEASNQESILESQRNVDDEGKDYQIQINGTEEESNEDKE